MRLTEYDTSEARANICPEWGKNIIIMAYIIMASIGVFVGLAGIITQGAGYLLQAPLCKQPQKIHSVFVPHKTSFV